MATKPSPAAAAVGGRITAGRWNSDLVAMWEFLDLKRPACYLVQSTPSPAFSAGNFSGVGFDTEVVDRDEQHDANEVTRIRIGKTLGWYEVSGSIAWFTNGTGQRRGARVALNGVGVNGSEAFHTVTAAPLMTVIPRVLVRASSPTDYVQLQAWHDATSSISTAVSGAFRSSFTAVYLGS